jgi:hypothetical protein
MEVLGCAGWVAHSHVDFFLKFCNAHGFWRWVVASVSQLQISFDSARRVLWTLAIITVRQKHNKTVLHIPLGLTTCDELVNHNLTSISKVSKLCFPKDQTHWLGHCIAILKTEDGILTK